METLPEKVSQSLNESQVELLISQAIDKQVPVETMERLLAMRKELKAEYAQEQFNIAMAAFQAECPVIKKTKAVRTKDGTQAYTYAPIEAIVAQVKELIRKHGFSYSIETETQDGFVKAICVVHHVLGHSKSSSFQVPVSEGTRVMSASQVYAAALTFAKRYAFCNAFGILTGDTDNDAKKEEGSATEKQIEAIRSLLAQLNMKEIILLERFRVATLEDLSSVKASNAIKILQSKINLKLNNNKEN